MLDVLIKGDDMKLNGNTIDRSSEFPPCVFNLGTKLNFWQVNIPSHSYKRFNTGTRWVYKRTNIPYKYSRSDLGKQRLDHPFNMDAKYKNLGVLGFRKRNT